MNVLDLFSGIGGFSLGLERAGMETAAFCEIDPFCKNVLKDRWPSKPTFPGIYALNSLLKRVRTPSSRAASRAKTFHSLERVPDLPASVQDSSGLSYEPFAWFDHGSRCWRTWQRCLVEGWTQYSGGWPRSGMTRNGIAYRRQPLVPLTSATASGSLLPTPIASNTKATALRSAGRSPMSFLGPIPTPTVHGNYNRKGASPTSNDGLATWVRKWPTPVARDWKGQGMSKARRESREPDNLCSAVQVTDGSGTLNPPWVEWLMGFPLGWTESERSEMPSFRKFQRSLAARFKRA